MLDSGWIRFGIANIALASGVYLAKSMWDLTTYIFDVVIIIFMAWIVSLAMKRLVSKIHNFLPMLDTKLNRIAANIDPNLEKLAILLNRLSRLTVNIDKFKNLNFLKSDRIFQRLIWASIPIAYLMVLLPIVMIFVIIVPITLEQAVSLSEDLPNFAATLSKTIDDVESFAGSLGLISGNPDTENSTLLRAGEVIGLWVQNNAIDTLQGATKAFVTISLVFALSIYMVLEGSVIMETVYKLIPENYHNTTRSSLTHLDTIFFGYLRSIFTMVALYSIMVTAVMLIAGLPFALPIGILSGLIQLIPIAGEIIALGAPILVAFLTGTITDTTFLAITLIGWSILMNNIVLPKIMGSALKMPGLFVLLAVVLGTRFAGPWGAVLGVPVAGFIYSIVLAWTNRDNSIMKGNQYKLPREY